MSSMGRALGPGRLFVGVGLQMVTVAIWFLAYSRQVDMGVFRFAGGNLSHGRPLYAIGLTGQRDGHLFNYPPFAAVVFIPLAALPVDLLRLIVPFANLAVLALAIRRCWRALGIESGGWELRSLTMLCTGALLWLEPVRTNVILGQINIVLLASVLFDLPLRTGARWTGAGVGLAAGIKLTPLLFIPFLLVTGRLRAAAVATGTFAATVLAGFAVVPSQAHRYWFGGTFTDIRRVGPIDSTGNESLRGMIGRMALPAATTTAVWFVAAVLVAGGSLAVAAYADTTRRTGARRRDLRAGVGGRGAVRVGLPLGLVRPARRGPGGAGDHPA